MIIPGWQKWREIFFVQGGRYGMICFDQGGRNGMKGGKNGTRCFSSVVKMVWGLSMVAK